MAKDVSDYEAAMAAQLHAASELLAKRIIETGNAVKLSPEGLVTALAYAAAAVSLTAVEGGHTMLFEERFKDALREMTGE